MTPQQKKSNAERLLRDETLLEAFSMIEQEAVEVFRYPTASQEDIMEAHRMVGALGALRAKLEAFILDGQLAERRNK